MPAVIVLAYLSLFTLGLMDNVRGPFFPEILEDMQLSGTAGSAFFAVTSFLAFFGSWYCHKLVGRRDVLTVLAAVSLVFAFGYGGISRATDYIILLFFCAVFGWAYGTLNVLQNVIVCEAASVNRRRRLLNGLQGMYGLAALMAPLAATWLRTIGLGWRSAFLILAFLPLIVVILAWRHRGEVKTHEGPREVVKLRGREAWVCAGFALMLSLYLWGELSVSTRLVLWLRTEQGFSPDAADVQLAIFFATLLGGRLALAFVELKGISNPLILMISVFSSAVLYMAGLYISPYFMAFTGLTLAPFFPVIMDQAAATFGAKGAQAVGVIIGVGNLSVMVMHVAIGTLTDRFDLSTALLCGPLALVLIGFGLVWVRWQERRALTP